MIEHTPAAIVGMEPNGGVTFAVLSACIESPVNPWNAGRFNAYGLTRLNDSTERLAHSFELPAMLNCHIRALIAESYTSASGNTQTVTDALSADAVRSLIGHSPTASYRFKAAKCRASADAPDAALHTARTPDRSLIAEPMPKSTDVHSMDGSRSTASL